MRNIRIIHGVNSATIGRVGENGVSQLVMDASDWESEFPGGALNLFMGRADPIHTIQALSDRVAALETAAVTNDTGGIQL